MAWWKLWEEKDEAETDGLDYYQEGVELAREERYHEALTSFRLAVREDPDNVAALEQMGVVYTRIGMTDEAIKTYRKVLESREGSAAAHYGLGFLFRKRGDVPRAIGHLEAFLENQPDDPAASEHVTHAREVLGELQEETTSTAGTDTTPADA